MTSIKMSCPKTCLNDDGDSDPIVIERTVFCVEEFVLEHCFSRQLFDCAKFIELMNGLAHFDFVRQVLFTKK